jgi:carbon monoxide dehydrogenase subunit G
MELEHSFTVPVPEARAWEVLLDVERVAPCMPGATLDSVDGDVISGRIKVKVGPIAMTYAGTARFTERDPAAHVMTLEASGKETRGAGTASAKVRSMLEGQNGQTHVVVHTTLNVTGRPAQFGRGVMAEVGGKLIGVFASNLANMLAAEQPSAEQPSAEQPSAEQPSAEQPSLEEVPLEDGLGQPIEKLNLSLRSYNSLRREGIHTVRELAAKTREQLLAIDHIGPASVEEIRQKLADLGLTLADSPASGNGLPASAPAPAAQASHPATVPSQITAAPSASTATATASYDSAGASDDDAIDLLSVAGIPVLKRAAPVVAAIAAIAVIALRLRVRRKRSRG